MLHPDQMIIQGHLNWVTEEAVCLTSMLHREPCTLRPQATHVHRCQVWVEKRASLHFVPSVVRAIVSSSVKKGERCSLAMVPYDEVNPSRKRHLVSDKTALDLVSERNCHLLVKIETS